MSWLSRAKGEFKDIREAVLPKFVSAQQVVLPLAGQILFGTAGGLAGTAASTAISGALTPGDREAKAEEAADALKKGLGITALGTGISAVAGQSPFSPLMNLFASKPASTGEEQVKSQIAAATGPQPTNPLYTQRPGESHDAYMERLAQVGLTAALGGPKAAVLQPGSQTPGSAMSSTGSYAVVGGIGLAVVILGALIFKGGKGK